MFHPQCGELVCWTGNFCTYCGLERKPLVVFFNSPSCFISQILFCHFLWNPALVVIIICFLTQNSCTPPYKTPVISLSFLFTSHFLVYPLSFLCLFWSIEKMMEIIRHQNFKFPNFHKIDKN